MWPKQVVAREYRRQGTQLIHCSFARDIHRTNQFDTPAHVDYLLYRGRDFTH